MQELLNRISRLDPAASHALRVIACFDELTVGNVNTRGLLAAAAALSGCVAGCARDDQDHPVRITPRGEAADGPAAAEVHPVPVAEGLSVWLERSGPAAADDAIVLERLALAVRLRHGHEPGEGTARRHLTVLVDDQMPAAARCTAAAAVGLTPTARYRVVAAPLFAVWGAHPTGPEDVVPTALGPLHLVVVRAADTVVRAVPCGVGVAATVDQLHHSFRTALVALRLSEGTRTTAVLADDYAGLVDLLADAPPTAHHPDVGLVAELAVHPWGSTTLDALVTCGSVRQAARRLGVHHSTVQSRLETITAGLGFDPLDGFGRVRLGVAYLTWRIHSSRALDLPAPGAR